MWTFEDIELLNPAETNQKSSFLQHVIHIGAASEKLLCETAELLEQRGEPFVAAFTQLPFLIGCSDTFFTVPGYRKDICVDLAFTPICVTINLDGRLVHVLANEVGTSNSEVVWLTQVTAIVRLWHQRARLYQAYINCLSPLGFKNEIIGYVKNWMDLSEAQMSFPKRRHAPLTAKMFQAEVAHRIRTEINYALQTFLRAYSVANLEQIPAAKHLYSYFVMIAPGRLACAEPPIPIISGLSGIGKQVSVEAVCSERIYNVLAKRTHFEDRVLEQLMAMHRLLQQGEPELALIGCVTAIEWFLNERFPQLIRHSKSGYEISASISVCLKSGVLNFLKDQEKAHLETLSQARNSIVHGAPPKRMLTDMPNMNNRKFIFDKKFVAAGLFLALDVYRAVNLNVIR